MSVKTDYTKCKIVNIHRGKGKRSEFIYAQVVDEDGEIVIYATLDYIVECFESRLPVEEE